MTKKIRNTDPRLLGFLNRTVQKLFAEYEQLNAHSTYRIAFESKTRDIYVLSFWTELKDASQQKRRIEIPLTSVTNDQWFDYKEGEVSDLTQRMFEVRQSPFMAFNLTFDVVKVKGKPVIRLKRIQPSGLSEYSLASEPYYETRTAST